MVGSRRALGWRAVSYAGVALVVVLGAGCAQIPTNGPIVPGPTPGEGDIEPVRIAAEPPRSGASPAQIVQGFLDAMSTYQVGFPLAREFLSSTAESAWAPLQNPIQVYDSPDLAVGGDDDGAVRFSARRSATIEPTGQYVVAPPDTELVVELSLVEEAGEWRIAQPPPGLLITTLDLENDYSPYVTHYPSAQGNVLVPDAVWLPSRGPSLPTILAQALVDGPTATLGGAVANAFPPGTVVRGVMVRGGTATVDLDGPVAETDDSTRRTMAAQLAYTLTSIPGITTGIALTSQGEELGIADLPAVMDRGDFLDRDPLAGLGSPSAYALADGRLVTVDPATGATSSVDGPLGENAAAIRSIAVSLDETLLATVSENGRQVTTQRLGFDGSELGPQTYTGSDLTTPSWDRYLNVWVADRVAEGVTRVYVLDPDGELILVNAPLLESVRVLALRVAPDGARAAATVRRADGETELLLLRIERSPDAITLAGVEGRAAIAPALGTVSDLAWSGLTDLAVVVTAPQRPAQPVVVRVDGSAEAPEAVTGVAAIAAFPEQLMLAISEEGTLRRQASPISWVTLGAGSAVTYPG